MGCISADLVEAARVTVGQLRQRGLHVVTAESCTAGLIAAALSHAEGASDLLEGSFVTYTKEQKETALGVARDILRSQGAVNQDVAAAMAAGALVRSSADIALSVTGVLGPSPDEDGNPVGLVYFGCAQRNKAPTMRKRDYGAKPADALRREVIHEALRILKECA